MSGPAFLLVYAVLAIALNLGLRRYLRQREAARSARFMEFAQDPYQVAYLRAGADEALRLVIFSLLDRGLLEESDGKVRRAREDADSFARRIIEKAVLARCTGWTELTGIESQPGVKAAFQGYQHELQKHFLLADARLFTERFLPFVASLALLVGVAVARSLWAVAHGRHNIGFLLIFALIGGIALVIAWRRRRTGLGDAALDRLALLFADLKRRAANLVPGGQSNDAVLTAALFGLAILPADSFPYLARVFPKPKSGGDGGSSSSDSSSDSGGCGGGCGGCGG